jgi:hypothetical protein
MKYQFRVVETVATDRIYTVEANSPEAAQEKALIGDTVAEDDLGMGEVINREILLEVEE